jgi:hypothetical protein
MQSHKVWNPELVTVLATTIFRRMSRHMAVAGLALATVTSCARVSTESVMMRGPGLPKPELIIVHDYQMARDEVQLDSGIGSRIERLVQDTPEEQDRLKLEQSVARIGTTTLVEEIRKLGLRAEPAAMALPGAGSTLSIEGQILSINEGNKTRRLIIGFGAGASEVRTLTQVYEVTGGEHRLVDDFYTTAKSSRKPGVGPMAGAGAAAGRAATSAAASTGIGIASERSQTAEADAQHAAREIAKQLAQLFVEQGWISQEQANKLFWDR